MKYVIKLSCFVILFLFSNYAFSDPPCKITTFMGDLEHSSQNGADLLDYFDDLTDAAEYEKACKAWGSIWNVVTSGSGLPTNHAWRRAKALVDKIKTQFNSQAFADFVKQGGADAYEELGKILNKNQALSCNICPGAAPGLANRKSIEEVLDFIEQVRASNLPTAFKNTFVAGLKTGLDAARGRIYEASRALANHTSTSSYDNYFPGNNTSKYDKFDSATNLYEEWKSVQDLYATITGPKYNQFKAYLGTMETIDATSAARKIKYTVDQRLVNLADAQQDMLDALVSTHAADELFPLLTPAIKTELGITTAADLDNTTLLSQIANAIVDAQLP